MITKKIAKNGKNLLQSARLLNVAVSRKEMETIIHESLLKRYPYLSDMRIKDFTWKRSDGSDSIDFGEFIFERDRA
jgi:hypothetical protein